MSYAPDPGDVFASDVHRRVMANLPNPDEDGLVVEALQHERVAKDDHLFVGTDELNGVLQELEADGHAEQADGRWRNTQEGFDTLTDKETA